MGKHKEDSAKYVHQDDPDKERCGICGKLTRTWRMFTCHYCGLRMCQLCWGRHWHNEG